MKDYYLILGVSINAKEEEVKAAYRKLSKKFHPDSNNQDKFFEERFKDIQEAYSVLIDPISRENFDLLQMARAQAPSDLYQREKDLVHKEHLLELQIQELRDREIQMGNRENLLKGIIIGLIFIIVILIASFIMVSLLSSPAKGEKGDYTSFRNRIETREEIQDDIPDSLRIVEKIESNPTPEVGFPEFYDYMRKNLRYPEAAREKEIEGKVVLQFVITQKGRVANMRVVKGLGYGCDEEAIRLVKEGPSWIAGNFMGRAASIKVTLEVYFYLDKAKYDDIDI